MGAVGVAAASVPLGHWLTQAQRAPRRGPFGTLRPDPDGVLDLLEGFRYRVLTRAGERMSDGNRVPRRPDGMACFEGPGSTLILMRNHELPGGLRARLSAAGPAPREAYDPDALGGVTRVVLDASTLAVRSSNLVLAGTVMNCAGGPSPWGWLSCEESVDPGHGWVFLCDPQADRVREPVRIESYGRFRHEAAAIDPATNVAYLTEDRPGSCLYRFVPHDRERPFEGRLQAMRVRGREANTSRLPAGARVEIDWVDVHDAASPNDDLRLRARRDGAALIARGEGLCFAEGAVHACATAGGPIEAGQILRIRDGRDGGTLEVVACSTDRDVLDMPDNVTVSPAGTLFFTEDGMGDNYVRAIGADGLVFDLARNALSSSEMCGVCFSPDGGTLFVNIQEDGLTLAISGPFDRLRA